MKIPETGRRRALVIVDAQEAFLRPHNLYVLDNIASIIQHVPYDFYVDANFDVEDGSLWEKQLDWKMPPDSDTSTNSKVASLLGDKERITIQKDTRSVFKGKPDLKRELEKRGIEEVHLVGLATHDCVLASAFDAFDYGFLVYVLEEGSESTTPGRHNQGISLLRNQNMTNNSSLAKTKEYETK